MTNSDIVLFLEGTSKDGKYDGPRVYYNNNGTVWENWTGTFTDGVKVK